MRLRPPRLGTHGAATTAGEVVGVGARAMTRGETLVHHHALDASRALMATPLLVGSTLEAIAAHMAGIGEAI